jgi:hypothetical protein
MKGETLGPPPTSGQGQLRPGRALPSRNSRLAPPPVLMNVTLSEIPLFLIALTESPPPMIEMQSPRPRPLRPQRCPWRIRQFRKCPWGRSRGRSWRWPRPRLYFARWSWDRYRPLPSRPQCCLPGCASRRACLGPKSRAGSRRLSSGRRNSTPFGLRLFEGGLGRFHLVRLGEAESPTLPPWARRKGVGHGPANEDGVGLVEQRIDDHDLVAHLGPAQDDNEGTLRIGRLFAKEGQLLFNEEPADTGLRNRVTPSVLAWARWAVPKASLT